MVVFGDQEEVVGVDGILEDHIDVDAHVFVSRHWGIKVEVLDVGGSELGARGGDYTVKEKFGFCHLGGWGADGFRIVDEVTACGDTDEMHLFFMQLDLGNKSGIGRLASCRQGGQVGEVYGVGTSSANVLAALGYLSKLACIG